MNFKHGDEIRVKVSRKDWEEFFNEVGIENELRKAQIISDARLRQTWNAEPLKVTHINRAGYVEFVDSNGKTGKAHKDWFMLYQNQKKEKASQYRMTEEGFMTCDDNWLPENRWF